MLEKNWETSVITTFSVIVDYLKTVPLKNFHAKTGSSLV